jgi:hypothetical protein
MIDHITPVSKGGTNDIENLATACRDCNSGKSDRRLSDLSEVEKSRKQLEEIRERKNMIDMIVQWRKELRDHAEYEVNIIQDTLYSESDITGYGFSDTYRKQLKNAIRKYGFDAMLSATYIAIDTYVKKGDIQSVGVAMDKLGGIAYNQKLATDNPKQFSYIKVKRQACLTHNLNPWQFEQRFPTPLYDITDEEKIMEMISSYES